MHGPDSTPENTGSETAGGANLTRARAYNERLVLSLVRRHGELTKAELARLTGLSAQTVTVIMLEMERDGLLIRGHPIRGKVGQPLIPLSINPDGAFGIGLKIGRRSAALVLMDFVGEVRHSISKTYPLPIARSLVGLCYSRHSRTGFTIAGGPT